MKSKKTLCAFLSAFPLAGNSALRTAFSWGPPQPTSAAMANAAQAGWLKQREFIFVAVLSAGSVSPWLADGAFSCSHLTFSLCV